MYQIKSEKYVILHANISPETTNQQKMNIQKETFSSPITVGVETNSCRTPIGQLFIGESDNCPSADKQLFAGRWIAIAPLFSVCLLS